MIAEKGKWKYELPDYLDIANVVFDASKTTKRPHVLCAIPVKEIENLRNHDSEVYGQVLYGNPKYYGATDTELWIHPPPSEECKLDVTLLRRVVL